MNEDEAPKPDLHYLIANKGTLLVVSFIGSFTKSAAPILEQCQAEVTESKANHVVLSLHDVDDVPLNGLNAFVKLQMKVREKGMDLRLCFLKPEILRILLDRAVIRREKVVLNLKEAIESFGIVIK